MNQSKVISKGEGATGLRELTANEIEYVSGAGALAGGAAGIGMATTASLSASIFAGATWGLMAGGLVGAAVGALVGTGYLLATSGGGSGRKRTDTFSFSK